MRKLTGAALVALVGVVAPAIPAEAGSGRVTVWQATDGYQFQVIPVPQNPPWGCVPLKSPVKIPAEWTRD